MNIFQNQMRFKYLLLLGFIKLLFFIQTVAGKCSNPIELTRPITSHHDEIIMMKLTKDYKKLFSLDTYGNFKIWNFHHNHTQPLLQLKYSFKINGVFVDYRQGLYIWNEGEKIFAHQCFQEYQRNCNLTIFNYDQQTDNYYQNQKEKINLENWPITAITVNKKGDTIYFASYCQRISRYEFNGSNWINTTPSYLKQNIYGCINYITLNQKQDKLIILYYDYNDGLRTIKIFSRKNDSQEYSLHQTTKTSNYGLFSCHLSTNQKFINCYGTDSKYENYMYDQNTDLFINVSKYAPQFYTSSSFMDKNQVFTTVIDGVNPPNNIQNHKFSYDKQTNKSSYSLLNRFKISKAKFVNLVIGHEESKFLLFAAVEETSGKIYFSSCHFAQDVQQTINKQKKLLKSQIQIIETIE